MQHKHAGEDEPGRRLGGGSTPVAWQLFSQAPAAQITYLWVLAAHLQDQLLHLQGRDGSRSAQQSSRRQGRQAAAAAVGQCRVAAYGPAACRLVRTAFLLAMVAASPGRPASSPLSGRPATGLRAALAQHRLSLTSC